MNLEALARALLLGAAALAVAGVVVYALAKLGLPRLPGDIAIEGRHWKVYFPIATSIVLSVVLTVVLNLFLRR